MARCNTSMLFAVGILACSFLMARGESRIVMPDNVAGDEVRNSASAFLTKLAEGDEKGVKELFAGEADQQKVLDAYFEWMASFDALTKRLTEKFGGPQAVSPVRRSIRELADHQKEKLMVLNGDVATLAVEGKLYDWGMELHLVNGKWKVTHLTASHELAAGVRELIERFAAVAKKVDRDVESGRTTSSQDAVTAFRADLSTATQMNLKHSPRPNAGQAAKWNGLNAATLGTYWGKDLMSPEVTRLVASMPGTPHVDANREFSRLVDGDGGMAILFRPGMGIQRFHLFAGGSEGYLRYPGELPNGLVFSDTRKNVEKKLGRPISSGGGGHGLAYYAEYPQSGITVFYAKDGARDPNNPIEQVMILPLEAGAEVAAKRPANGPRITFRLVVSDPTIAADELPCPADGTQRATLRVSREILLDETSIANVYPVPERTGSTRLATDMEMTDDGAKKLKEATSENVGRQLAIVLDGQVVTAPNIRTAIGKNLVISSGSGTQEMDNDDIRGRLHAAVFTLPTEPK